MIHGRISIGSAGVYDNRYIDVNQGIGHNITQHDYSSSPGLYTNEYVSLELNDYINRFQESSNSRMITADGDLTLRNSTIAYQETYYGSPVGINSNAYLLIDNSTIHNIAKVSGRGATQKAIKADEITIINSEITSNGNLILEGSIDNIDYECFLLDSMGDISITNTEISQNCMLYIDINTDDINGDSSKRSYSSWGGGFNNGECYRSHNWHNCFSSDIDLIYASGNLFLQSVNITNNGKSGLILLLCRRANRFLVITCFSVWWKLVYQSGNYFYYRCYQNNGNTWQTSYYSNSGYNCASWSVYDSSFSFCKMLTSTQPWLTLVQ